MPSPDLPFRNRIATPTGGSRPHVHGEAAASHGSARAARKGTPAQSGDLTLAEFVGRVRTGMAIIRNRWFAALLAAVAVGALVGYAMLRGKPEHIAITTLLAQSTLDEILDSRETARERKDAQENLLQNHLSVMNSRRFSVKLAQEFSQSERERLMDPYLGPDDVATDASFEQFLAARIDAERERNRDFFTLSFRHQDPDMAVMVANRMTAAYLKVVQDELQQANLTASGILKAQAEMLKVEISELEDEHRDFRKQNHIISDEGSEGILAERLRRIDQQLATFRVERVKLETQLMKAREDLAANPLPFDNTLLANFGNNQELRQELDRLTAQREVLATRYGSRHAKMREIDGSIRSTRDTVEKNFALALRDLESQYANARLIETNLTNEFDEAFEAVIESGRLSQQLQIFVSEIAAKREALTDLLRRINNAEMLSKIPSDVMRVIDPAFIARPRLSRTVMAGVFIFFFGGIGFVATPLLLHLFDQRITSATDIESELGTELLGGVPRMTGVTAAERPHVVRDGIHPDKIEPFMAIVAQLELISAQPGCRTFLVTSAVPGEGKSTVVSNLGAAFSKLGRRTLIIDSDLRRPTQHLLHRSEDDRGLMAWARAGYPMENLFGADSPLGVQCLIEGAHLIGAGGEDSQPMAYLISEQTAVLFEELKSHYDVILIDTPPAGLFQDALVLTRTRGETLFVAREAYAPVAQIRRALADLRKTAAPPLGVILNDFSSSTLNPRLAYSTSYRGYRYRVKPARPPAWKSTKPGALT